MIGAITGDIVGSVYEWNNIRTKHFPLFSKECFFTDDSVMTIACAQAVMDGGSEEDFVREYQKFGREYPGRGYGARFSGWLREKDPKPYRSWGNGSAMRVAPCGWMMDMESFRKTGQIPDNELAVRSAVVTHDHPEGIKGAQAVADAIFLARVYKEQTVIGGQQQPAIGSLDELKEAIRRHTEETYGYNLHCTLDEIRPVYEFNESCQETVPEAIIAFLESTDFEDAIRNGISLGGDSDTLTAITGSIAEAAYGIPEDIREKTLSYLDAPLRDVINRWETEFYPAYPGK